MPLLGENTNAEPIRMDAVERAEQALRCSARHSVNECQRLLLGPTSASATATVYRPDGQYRGASQPTTSDQTRPARPALTLQQAQELRRIIGGA